MTLAAADAAMEEAIAEQRAGRFSQAERLYRLVLQTRPRDAVANHNLGVLLAQGGAAAQSLPHFKAALEADRSQGLYWLSYARGLLAADEAAAALQLLQAGGRGGLAGPGFDALLAEALARTGPSPSPARDLDALAEIHLRAGRTTEAVAAYRQALAIDPELAEAHFHLASVLSETGQIAEGFTHFMRRAQLVRGGNPPTGAEPPHKLKHDREQRDYLAAAGVTEPFHIEDGARLPGPAVNPANATPALAAQWQDAEPQVVVIEDFLTPQALETLRKFCARSTIWRRVYDAGYIGATPEDGFSCPLLAQIAEEIQTTYPEIFQPHRFRYLGAFKYDSEHSRGTNTHADNSAVNVNFYIAPDDANLDAESGGMEIWDVCAPDEATMRRCNGDEAAARAFLESSGAKSMIVPHRANRALIFRSGLFHKTDHCTFKEGYLNKRINVSLLFGEFDAATR